MATEYAPKARDFKLSTNIFLASYQSELRVKVKRLD